MKTPNSKPITPCNTPASSNDSMHDGSFNPALEESSVWFAAESSTGTERTNSPVEVNPNAGLQQRFLDFNSKLQRAHTNFLLQVHYNSNNMELYSKDFMKDCIGAKREFMENQYLGLNSGMQALININKDTLSALEKELENNPQKDSLMQIYHSNAGMFLDLHGGN